MKINSLLLAIFCLIPCTGMAVTVDPPHGGAASGLSCATCHTTHLDLGGSGYDNICLTCHRPGMPKGGSKPFTLADAANPFGTMTGLLPAKMYQTSHNWNSPDNSPAAGAQPPMMAAMTTNRLAARTGNRLACVRCHDQHSNSKPPFLRGANDRDQLCLDCHRSRNTNSHITGSHPVNISYPTTASAKFNSPPVNANPANPTADLGKSLVKTGGKVLCSTCHAVHYGDSSSATFDNHSGYYDLKPADGNLLRTDLHGETAEATNICTNCHAGKIAHNGRGQNIQCADCHGAHVEFDKNDPTDQKAPNVWLVRRYMNFSTLQGSAGKVPVYFQSTTDKNYKDAAGNGVCQSCHEIPTGTGYPPEHSNPSSASCNSCHFHANSAGSFSASGGDCNSCHGYPPQTNKPGGPRGYAAGSPFTNESSSAHLTHAGGITYSELCVECHQGNSHRTGTFQDVFLNTGGLVASRFGAIPAFDGTNPQAPTCSLVYCHSDGAPRNAALQPVLTTKAIPGWANGRGAIVGRPDECNYCHGDASTLTTNSHEKHLAGSTSCAACHNATVSGNTTIKDFALHANGTKNIQFSSFNSAGLAGWNEPAATCSTVYCHSSVQGTGGTGAPTQYRTPLWGGASPGCGGCHADQATDATGTGSHRAHTVAANKDCITCHPGYSKTTAAPATHANGRIELGATGFTYSQGSGSTNPAGNGYGSCSASICHGSGAPVWGATSTAPVNGFPYSASQCGKCHSEEGSVTAGAPFYSTAIPKVTLNSDAKVGAHTAHLTSADNLHPSLVCADCHGTVNLNDGTHMNGTTNFNWSVLARTGNLSPSYSGGICSNVYCHGGAMPGGDTSGSNRTPAWNNPGYLPATLTVAGCSTCHGFPPPVAAGHPAVTLPSGFPETAPIGNTCSCHGNISPAGNSYATIFVVNTLHINGMLEGGQCDTCHGYPPARAGFKGTHNNWSSARTEDYFGGGGAHTISNHVSSTARPSDGFAYCNQCHSPADHTTSPPVFMPSTNIKVNINPRYRLESAKPARYTSNRLDGNAHRAGTCSNISCHFGASPVWN